MLRLVDVEVETSPSGYYEVYVNVPEGEVPVSGSDAYVGNMTFFGAVPSEVAEYQYSLATTEQRLRSAERWDGTFRVTLVKAAPIPPRDFFEQLKRNPSLVRIGRIAITRE